MFSAKVHFLLFSFFFATFGFDQVRFGKLKCSSYEITSDSSVAIVHKKNKTGVYNKERKKFLLKWQKQDDIVYLPGEDVYAFLNKENVELRMGMDNSGFSSNWNVNANNEIIFSNSSDKHFLILDGNTFTYSGVFMANDESLKKIPDMDNNDQVSIKPPEFFQGSNGITRLNDSLVLITNYERDYDDPFASPLHSILYPDEDSVSLTDDGFWVVSYPPPVLGREFSGVYNLNTSSWFIKPEYGIINKTDQGFLLETVVRGDDYENELIYSFIDNDGQIKFENKEIVAIKDEYTSPTFLTIRQSDTLIPLPERAISSIPGFGIGMHQYGIDAENKYSLYRLFDSDIQITPEPLTKPKEFLNYNEDHNFYQWVENGRIYVQTIDTSVSVSLNGKLIINLQDYLGEDYRITQIEGEDTSMFQTANFYNSYVGSPYSEIYMDNENLIINHIEYFDNISPYLEELDMGFYDEFDIENLVAFDVEVSSVWSKENGCWKQKTPYYSSVEPVPFGFLVSTGSYMRFSFEEWADPGSSNTFLVLDKNYKAMDYLDFYDFSSAEKLDFGVSLCTEQGCFLVNNSGKAITGAEWDTFELIDGKVRAVKWKPLEDEWFWDYEWEEIIEKEAWFDLNPD